MTKMPLRYIQRFTDRHGKVRHYFRREGRSVPLPGDPESAEFHAAYSACLTAEPAMKRPTAGAPRPPEDIPGSFAALAVAWFQAGDFRALAPSTQQTYRRAIAGFVARHGHRPVRGAQTVDIFRLVDEKSATPGQANKFLSVLRLMLRFAMQRGWRKDNPALAVTRVRYKRKGFTPWSDQEIARYRAYWAVGTRERLALELLLCTGQRRSDVIKMGRHHVRAGKIEVAQQKTGRPLLIPIHPRLREAIDACTLMGTAAFLITRYGNPFASGTALYNWFVHGAREAGIEKGFGPHGLRKAAGRHLAEAGCTSHEVMSILGHVTLSEAQKYTDSVDQERMAEEAMRKLTGEG